MLTYFGKTPQHKISRKFNLLHADRRLTDKHEKANAGIFAGSQCKRAKKNKYCSAELFF